MKPRIYVRPPALPDQREFLASVRKSHLLHAPWTVAPTNPAQFRAYIEQMAQPTNCAFLVCRRDDEIIAGVINITNIVLGSFCAAPHKQ